MLPILQGSAQIPSSTPKVALPFPVDPPLPSPPHAPEARLSLVAGRDSGRRAFRGLSLSPCPGGTELGQANEQVAAALAGELALGPRLGKPGNGDVSTSLRVRTCGPKRHGKSCFLCPEQLPRSPLMSPCWANGQPGSSHPCFWLPQQAPRLTASAPYSAHQGWRQRVEWV